MHFFFSFLKKTIEVYNENNTDDKNKFLMLNGIALSNSILEIENDLKLPNALSRQILSLKAQGLDATQFDVGLNVLINNNQDIFSKALNISSKFTKLTLASELQERKMSWDTYA